MGGKFVSTDHPEKRPRTKNDDDDEEDWGTTLKQILDFNLGNRRTTTMRPSGHQQVWTFLERMWLRSDLRATGTTRNT
jgi:hypothetical protein